MRPNGSVIRAALMAVAAVFAATAIACSRAAEAETHDNLTYTLADDPVIVAAEQEAAKSLPIF